jgi:hypothetical protein
MCENTSTCHLRCALPRQHAIYRCAPVQCASIPPCKQCGKLQACAHTTTTHNATTKLQKGNTGQLGCRLVVRMKIFNSPPHSSSNCYEIQAQCSTGRLQITQAIHYISHQIVEYARCTKIYFLRGRNQQCEHRVRCLTLTLSAPLKPWHFGFK